MTKCSLKYCKRDTIGGYKTCQHCRDRVKKSLRKRKRVVRVASEGYKICKHCCREFPLSAFKPTVVRRTKLTAKCASCRAIHSKTQKGDTMTGRCRKVWFEWKSSHVCEHCKTPDCIEADHTGVKKHACSGYLWWSCHGGVEALKAELKTCRPLCCFCHRVHSQTQRGVNKQPSTTKKRTYVNSIKLKIGECQLCKRKVNDGNFCAYDFDHLDEKTKTESISTMVNRYPLKKFFSLIDEEVKKCRLLCSNCHRKHTNHQTRKASVENVIKN